MGPLAVANASQFSFVDQFGYQWSFDLRGQSSAAIWLDGCVVTDIDTRQANATVFNNSVTFSADAGSNNTPFTYSLSFIGGQGHGVWTNVLGTGGGTGTVMLSLQGSGLPRQAVQNSGKTPVRF